MLIKWTRGPVGSWTFEKKDQRFTQPGRETVRGLLEQCERVASILEELELLRCEQGLFFGWRNGGANAPDKPFAIHRAGDISSTGSRLLSEYEASGGKGFPAWFKLFGRGTVYGTDGALEQKNLVWLDCTTLEFHMITVNTQSDVWLPCTLSSEPQEDLASLNAPRLEDALRRIESELGLELGFDPTTDYSNVERYGLTNHVDSEGVPVNVIYDDAAVESL